MFGTTSSSVNTKNNSAQQEKCLIQLFCCGVQKAGTTSFYSYLKMHPELAAPKIKELHFFDNEDIDWNDPPYHMLSEYFEDELAEKIRFDVTPIYCYWPPSIPRIYKYNPKAKLIILYRDPFERAWSQWCMEYARNAETQLFSDAIRGERAKRTNVGDLDPVRRVASYVDRGRYYSQLNAIKKVFPTEQTLCLQSSQLRDSPGETLSRVAKFLNINAFDHAENIREHTRPAISYPSMPTQEDLEFVISELDDEIVNFSTISGLDTSNWPCVSKVLPKDIFL